MARHLETAGFDAVGVANGETGLARLRYERPDVCVLDLMLPGIDGWRVIEQARDEGIGTPIVVVSARGTEHDRVHALEIGADDYLVKPFSMKELAARVARRPPRRQRGRAAPRRPDRDRGAPTRPATTSRRTSTGRAPSSRRRSSGSCTRSPREQGRVLTRDELLQRVWGRRATHRDRTVDVFVRKLREKVDRRAPRTPSSRRATASATSSKPSRVASGARRRCSVARRRPLRRRRSSGLGSAVATSQATAAARTAIGATSNAEEPHEERCEQDSGERDPQHGGGPGGDPRRHRGVFNLGGRRRPPSRLPRRARSPETPVRPGSRLRARARTRAPWPRRAGQAHRADPSATTAGSSVCPEKRTRSTGRSASRERRPRARPRGARRRQQRNGPDRRFAATRCARWRIATTTTAMTTAMTRHHARSVSRTLSYGGSDGRARFAWCSPPARDAGEDERSRPRGHEAR